MAARRLVIVMVVLLGISVLATALLPEPEPERDARQGQAEAKPSRPAPTGELVTARVDATAPEPALIELRVGDQLALTVRSPRADQVEIPELGELRFVGRLAPARFDILVWEQATYAIRLADADRLIGRIEVAPPRHGRRRG